MNDCLKKLEVALYANGYSKEAEAISKILRKEGIAFVPAIPFVLAEVVPLIFSALVLTAAAALAAWAMAVTIAYLIEEYWPKEGEGGSGTKENLGIAASEALKARKAEEGRAPNDQEINDYLKNIIDKFPPPGIDIPIEDDPGDERRRDEKKFTAVLINPLGFEGDPQYWFIPGHDFEIKVNADNPDDFVNYSTLEGAYFGNNESTNMRWMYNQNKQLTSSDICKALSFNKPGDETRYNVKNLSVDPTGQDHAFYDLDADTWGLTESGWQGVVYIGTPTYISTTCEYSGISLIDPGQY
jgi:hypothetical protein